VAEKVNLSPYHFQRMFTDWAGISPKKFLQYLSLDYAKGILKEQQATLFDAAFETGLSGTGRLHDLFINIEGMTPAEYKNGGKALSINFSYAETPFGNIIVASTSKGICYIAFADDKDEAFNQLYAQFPNASYYQVVDLAQQNALYIFTRGLVATVLYQTTLKGHKLPAEGLGSTAKDPNGRLEYLFNGGPNGGTTYSQSRGRQRYWCKPSGIF
jgi:AraC family transcriptional regulator of adaptative response/methylated-DNA-[protein]-cysteine methyltransferase